MIVEMTKKQILEVLRKEPLYHGRYAGADNGATHTPASHKACVFCAVGQIIRAAVVKSAPVGHVSVLAARETNRLDPIRELERRFESTRFDAGGTMEGPDTGVGRKRAIAFVKSKAFPAKVQLDIGMTKPRRGMKVVR